MVGGEVVETIVLDDKVWINCIDDSNSTCAIYVENTAKARAVSIGDKVW
jgi:hypothetical protein